MRNNEQKGTSRLNRYSVVDFTICGFHRKLCRKPNLHESNNACRRHRSEGNYDKYQATDGPLILSFKLFI